ncbi:serine/threonine-protein kinase LMTK1 isoform X1 [Gadus macrocephalus]|uniref:serine/threonine-protein kinase LMTK1 isoform X1 n=1 Tax=Gadus macrocephalus TaxID=80720 RepID=UPI0028CB5209|nr:serine/threonine-protein kinase LMTK1 isoform X1 [Gadus macrocephalus]
MLLALYAIAMSSAFFNPSFAFSSHFDTDGTPLSELSWPSSLAVVAVSFSGLFTFVFLMLACLCCKKGDIGFKEFDNTEGEEYPGERSTLASPSSQHGPEVYILPLTEVSLPVSKQPGRSIQLLKSSDVGRHSLLYLKEIGHGWFGKVLLGEVTEGLSTTQVVVKELTASASVHEQMQFVEEIQPYRTLQHPALLQCLAQCSEVTPYLLVMEFCPLGDLKSYLRCCQGAETEAPDAFILQRMACEIASGLLYLHKHNFIHSDLALRSCLLTSDMNVKIGDYGLSRSQYKEDYFVTPDQIWVPLRWIAPELIDEVHGNLLVVDQTKTSNVWSFGVTMWELFELGNQPYQHYSDRQVLTYAVKEQLLKLPKPQLDAPLAQRWYEVMQFCWLQPELRPSTEEIHLLVTYLCAKGSCEAEEDFEQRWNTLKPNLFGSSTHTIISSLALTPDPAPSPDPAAAAAAAAPAPEVELASSASSSFPLLEQFSDGFHSDSGDDLLTVTESVHGLNFEYKWEQARAEQPYCSSSTSGPLGQGNPHYQDVYYPVKGGASAGGCRSDSQASGVSPSYYESDHPGVVPVLSAHSPSVGSEYYIRIEEPVECNINLDDGVEDYSPRREAGDGRLSSQSWTGSSVRQTDAYWAAADNDRSAYDSDESLSVSLTMEPLMRRASSTSPVPPEDPHTQGARPSESQKASVHSEHMPTVRVGGKAFPSEEHLSSELQQNLLPLLGRTENSRSVSRAISSPSLGFCDPYLETSTENCTLSDSYCDVIGPLRKAVPIANHIIEVETGDGLQVGQRRSVLTNDMDGDLFSEADTTNWTSNHSANNNSLSFGSRHTTNVQGSYLDLQYTTSYDNTTELWPETIVSNSTVDNYKPFSYVENTGRETSSVSKSIELGPYIYLGHNEKDTSDSQNKTNSIKDNLNNSDTSNKPLFHSVDRLYSEPMRMLDASCINSPVSYTEPYKGHIEALTDGQNVSLWDMSPFMQGMQVQIQGTREVSESDRGLDSGVGLRGSSMGLVGLGDFSEDEDDDITDITSGIFADFNLDYAEVEEEEISPVKHLAGTAETGDALQLSPSAASPCDQAFSPDAFNTPMLPKSLDSGYDTENNESPEFFFHELTDPRESSPELSQKPELILQMDPGQGVCSVSGSTHVQLKGLAGKNPYRDSAYLSDYDAENERSPREEGSNFFAGPGDRKGNAGKVLRPAADVDLIKPFTHTEEQLTNTRQNISSAAVQLSQTSPDPECHSPNPGLSMLSPFPPEMGGCLTKESGPAEEDLGLNTQHSEDEPSSDYTSSNNSDPLATIPGGASTNHARGNRGSENYSPVTSVNSDSTLSDLKDDGSKDTELSEDSAGDEEIPKFNLGSAEAEEAKKAVNIEEDFEDIDAGECDSQDGTCAESCRLPGKLSSSSSFLTLCGEDMRAPLEEEEDDSDDSESDEELRTYNIQEEESEESEDDFTPVPVVVSDCSSASHLRSLLKMPTLLSQSFCDELEQKKKAVSFFDDVTVFLFDQESPTAELSDFSFSTAEEACGQDSGPGEISNHSEATPRPSEETCDPGDATCVPGDVTCDPGDAQGNGSAGEGGIWNCEDALPLEADPSLSDTHSETDTTSTSLSDGPEPPRPLAVATPLNRFCVSRFSITHVSDPYVGSPAGQDGDQQ